MKKFINPILFGLLIVFSLTTKGQNLGIDTSTINLGSLPDTINLNDNYTHNIVVQNKSAVSITDTIYLIGAIDSSGTLLSIDTVGSIFVNNFSLNDTVSISYTENYNALNGYKIGGNIVVVWPVAGSASTVDTLFKYVYIKNPVSIRPILALDEQVLIYPNPAKDYLYLSVKKSVKQVRIVDVNGRIIYQDDYRSKIDVSYFSKGIYFLQLEMKNEEQLFYKLIKE